MPDQDTQVQPLSADSDQSTNVIPSGRLAQYLSAQTPSSAQPQQPQATQTQVPAQVPTQPQKPKQYDQVNGYTVIGDRYVPNYVDPSAFTQREELLKDRNIEHRIYAYPTLDAANAARNPKPLQSGAPQDPNAVQQPNGRWIRAFRSPNTGQWYSDTPDENGKNLIDPRLVDASREPVDKATHAANWTAKEVIDFEHPDQFPAHHRTMEHNSITDEWRTPAGSRTPPPSEISEWTASNLNDWQTRHDVTQAASNYGSMFQIDKDKEREISNLEQWRRNSLSDPNKAAFYDPRIYDEQMGKINSRFDALKDERRNQLNNLPRIQQAIKASPGPSIGGAADSLGNPFGLSVGNKFEEYDPQHPEVGLAAGLNQVRKYQSPSGAYNVNGDSSLLEMMRQWTPKDDPRGIASGHPNDPDSYAATLAKTLGLKDGVSTPIKSIDSVALAKAMLNTEIPKKAKQYQSMLDDIAKNEHAPMPTATPPPTASPARISFGAAAAHFGNGTR